MPQGQLIKLAGEFTDDTLPRFYAEDAMLAKGSLLLIDPAHTTDPMGASLIEGARIPNVARSIALNLMPGGTTLSQMDGTLKVGATTSGKVILEKTTKGGVHGIVSQDKTKFAGSPDGVIMLFASSSAPHPVLTYMKANPAHLYYYSQWLSPTRAAATSDATQSPNLPASFGAYAASLAAYGNDYFFYNRTDDTGAYASRNISPGFNSLAANGLALAPQFRSMSIAANTGTLGNIDSLVAAEWGSRGLINTYPSTRPAYPSYILYREYIEDLTVTGRTYAEAYAVDSAMFTAAFAPGGRFHNDTYTSPATLA